jgi:hypothetical protein
VKVGNLCSAVKDAELREALKGPYRNKILARIAFACAKQQAVILRYLFPGERVQWIEEAREGRALEWIKKLM